MKSGSSGKCVFSSCSAPAIQRRVMCSPKTSPVDHLTFQHNSFPVLDFRACFKLNGHFIRGCRAAWRWITLPPLPPSSLCTQRPLRLNWQRTWQPAAPLFRATAERSAWFSMISHGWPGPLGNCSSVSVCGAAVSAARCRRDARTTIPAN